MCSAQTNVASLISTILSRVILVAILLLTFGINAFATTNLTGDKNSDSVQVYFRQAHIKLDPNYRNNGERLESFSRRFNNLLNNPTANVRNIRIVSGASPEGTVAHNRYLSDNRAQVVYDYLINNNLVDSSKIKIESRGENWFGLTNKVKESELPYKATVLNILSEEEFIQRRGKIVDGRKHQLMNLNGGGVWHELFNLYFADLRSTIVLIDYNTYKVINDSTRPSYFDTPLSNSSLSPPTAVISLPQKIKLPTLHQPQIISEEKSSKPFLMAIKTNLLYDALLVPNLGLEFYVGKNWSIAGSWMYAWWKNDNVHNYWRTYGGDIELRRWLGNHPLTGHHFGVYAQMLTYDFELGGRGYLGDKWTYGGGVSYGYSKSLSRYFNLDFTIGIGFLRSKYKEYLPLDGHYVWQSTNIGNGICPTKAEITLVWLIGRGYNRQKGGGRA